MDRLDNYFQKLTRVDNTYSTLFKIFLISLYYLGLIPIFYEDGHNQAPCSPSLASYGYSLIKLSFRVLMPPNPQFWGNKNFKVPQIWGI
jgi:hypothetical protein